MTRVGGHTEFGGWTIHLQAQAIPEPRGYDQPQATYDGSTVYDSAAASWVTLDCQLMQVTCGHGGRIDRLPGVRASLGRLQARLYDPQRVLDPKVSPYSLLARPGAPVRVVALSPGVGEVLPLWTGVTEEFTHDLLTGEGRLAAHDLVGSFSGVSTSEWTRPAESSRDRYAAINAMISPPLPYRFDGPTASLSAAKISGDLWSAGFLPVAESEHALLWVDQAGTLRRRDLGSGWGGMLLAGDCDTGAEDLIYTRLSSTVSDELLVNNVLTERLSIGDTDRPLRQRANTASIGWFGAATVTESRLQLVDDAALGLWMQRVLDLRANPRPTVTGMAVTLTDVFPWCARTVPHVVALEVGSPLDIRLTTRGTAGRWLMLVAGIEHSITPDDWVVSLELADASAAVPAAGGGYDAAESVYDVSKYNVTPIPAGV